MAPLRAGLSLSESARQTYSDAQAHICFASFAMEWDWRQHLQAIGIM